MAFGTNPVDRPTIRQVERYEDAQATITRGDKELNVISVKRSEIRRVIGAGAVPNRNFGIASFLLPSSWVSKGYYLSFIRKKIGGGLGFTQTEKVNQVPKNVQAFLSRINVNQIDNQLNTRAIFLKAQKTRLSAQIAQFQSNIRASQVANTTTTTSGGGNPSPPTTPAAPRDNTVKYNVSTVKEAYFYSGQSFFNQANENWKKKDPNVTSKFDNEIWAGNTPSKIEKANDLWKKGAGSKGMIINWNPPGNTSAGGAIDDGSTWGTAYGNKTKKRYGFQFLYNPTTISMSYGGVADVDPSLQSSGTEEYLLANPTVFKSTINIEVVINRMYDMRHLNSTGLKTGKISDFYEGNVPEVADLKLIYNKGTMYDVEFLLQTMFPYEPIESQFRGKTSDIGFLGASPVELHLGNNLKYVAQINSISVNHVIFDTRMVPLFSTVSINTNRIPDYKQGQNSPPPSNSATSSSATATRPANLPQGADAAERWIQNQS
jgi:hypothetical protein